MKIRTFALSGLVMSAAVSFWIGGTVQAVNANLPDDDDGENRISFVVLAHIYPILFNGDPADIDRLISEIAAVSPDVLVMPGDIIPGTTDLQRREEGVFRSEQEVRAKLERDWAQVFALFGRLNVPIWIAPGNHDISSYQSEFAPLVREVYRQKVGPPYFAKEMSGYRFVFLNSIEGDADIDAYGIGDEQAQWLEEELKSDSKFTFVFVHSALWYTGVQWPPGTGNLQFNWMARIHPILVDRVAYVFAGDGGHVKNYLFYERRDQVYYYVTGSGPAGVSFLHVVGDGSKITVLPHFLDIQSRPTTQPPPKAKSFGDTLPLSLLNRRTFWAGGVFGATVIGSAALMTWAYARRRGRRT